MSGQRREPPGDDLGRGMHYLLEGFRLLRRPGVRAYVIVPLTINITLFSGCLLYTSDAADDLLQV